ncbi:MAG TPA: enolase C-terminal domain-like protein [Lacipirellulaceae bacterium]
MSLTGRQQVAREMACRIVGASVTYHPQKLVTPLVLSTGTIDDLIEARATVTVETVAGRRAEGRGAVYLSDLWAWPDPKVPHERRVQILQAITNRAAAACSEIAPGEILHPLEIGLRLHHWALHELPAEIPVPALARAMCASPFDAAIHDAAGIATGRSAFRMFDEDAPTPSADSYFPREGAIAAIRRTIRQPRKSLPAWLVINKTDTLPDMISKAYATGGYRSFKLKITGRDKVEDTRRTIEVYRSTQAIGVTNPALVIDSNEGNPDAAGVLEYLEQLEALDAEAYGALAYIEQPTARDIIHAPFDWRPVAARKPVMLDEGLTDLTILDTAQQQGWSGLALKTCKGHSMLLAAAAWAHSRGLLLSLQDLTNPGIALIHGALVGAHLPTINGAELNSPQFTPAANADYIPRLSGLYQPKGGVHRLPADVPDGLGSRL